MFKGVGDLKKNGKRIIAVLLALALAISLVCINVFAEEYTSADGQYTYTLDHDNRAVITDYSGSEKNLEIPYEIDGISVSQIANEAFEDNLNLESVKVPDSIWYIGCHAFSGCKNLATFEMSRGLKVLGSCFLYNTKVTYVFIPKTLEKIQSDFYWQGQKDQGDNNHLWSENSPFYYSSVKNIELENGIESIPSYLFSNSNIENIVFPDSVKSIGLNVFEGCTNLKSVTYPKDYNGNIYPKLIDSYQSLKSITVPSHYAQYYDRIFSMGWRDGELNDEKPFENITVYGYQNSPTQKFADKYGYSFVDISTPAEGLLINNVDEVVNLSIEDSFTPTYELWPTDTTDIVYLNTDKPYEGGYYPMAGFHSNDGIVAIYGNTIVGKTPGDCVITATTSSGISEQFKVHVREIVDIKVEAPGGMPTCNIGESIDTSDWIVTLIYDDGYTEQTTDFAVANLNNSKRGVVKADIIVPGDAVNYYQYYSAYNHTHVKYKSIDVEIVDPNPYIESISIQTLPNKLTYAQRESLDTSGMVVVANYNTGKTEVIKDYKLSGYNALKKGAQTITVKYDDCSAKFEINVVDPDDIPDLSNLKIRSAAVSLGNNLSMQYKVAKTAVEGFENPYIVVTRNGKTIELTDYKEQGTDYVFTLKNITPQTMNDQTVALLRAEYKGRDYASEKITDFSVADYAYGMLEKATGDSYAKLRTLLVDLLNYGAAAQQYQNYKTDNLVNAKLTDEQKAMGSSEPLNLNNITNKNFVTIASPSLTWKSTSLVLNDSVSVKYKFTTTEIISDVSFVVNVTGKSYTYDSSAISDEGNGVYSIRFDKLIANNFRDDITITAYKNGNAISNTMLYSVESYASLVEENMPGTALANLTNAMMRYGISAEAYKAK